jgi:DNA invertase Pin-like site-specific DNA recombinase
MPSYVRGRARIGRHLPDAEIVALYAAGTDAYTIGILAGCCDQTVRDVVRAGGGTVRPRGGKPRRDLALPDAEIARLYRSGLSGVEVARLAGCSSGTLYNTLRRLGVEVRRSFEKAQDARKAKRRKP